MQSLAGKELRKRAIPQIEKFSQDNILFSALPVSVLFKKYLR
jgi:hypothetical protein